MKTYTQEEVDKIIADTVEACAKVCEELRDEDGYEAWNTECAAAIRARTDKEKRND